jgi:hypothetical protein
LRFNWQCRECGAYKWCGRDCEQIRRINAKVPPYQEDDLTETIHQATKFDRSAYMKARWAKKRQHQEREHD